MDPIAATVIGLSLINSYMKNQQDADLAERQRKIEQQKAKWYGFTHQAPTAIAEPNMLGNLIQGGVAGLTGGMDLSKLLKDSEKSNVTNKNTDTLNSIKAESIFGRGLNPSASQWQQLLTPKEPRSYFLGGQ